MSHFHKFDQAALRLAPALSVDVKSTGDGTITGYASVYGGPPDRAGDVVMPGAFARTLKEHAAEGTSPAMLWSHQLEAPVGRWEELREDDRGLFVRGRLNLQTSRGQEAYKHVSAGDAGGLSIGFLVAEGGRKYAGSGAYELTDLDLVEVSIVTVPAQPRARIAAVKSLGSKAELVDLLREVGLAKAAAARIAAGGWPALSQDPHDDEQIKALAARIKQATARIRS